VYEYLPRWTTLLAAFAVFLSIAASGFSLALAIAAIALALSLLDVIRYHRRRRVSRLVIREVRERLRSDW
jgi:Flp pilus assembly protein TadB